MTRLKRRPRLLIIAVAVLAALLVAETVVLGATVLRSGGAVKAVKIVTETTEQVISVSNQDTNITGMSLTMSVPSGQQAYFLITFSAVENCLDGSPPILMYCYVRVLVDGAEAAPGYVVFDAAPDSNVWEAKEANSLQFVAGPLAAGPHTVQAQGFIGGVSSSFNLYERTLSVMRMPAK